MIRRISRKPAITLSLFPFLAVLVCTMGALIVLLVAVIYKARTDAVAEAELRAQHDQTHEQQLEDLRIRKEDLEWRRSELEKQRAELQQRAAEQRLTLSHLEDHIRRLEEEWKQARQQADELTRLGDASQQNSQDAAAKLAELQRELAARREQWERAKQEASGRERAYAIIPYDGPNGTKRRPIYIECTDQGIILQPEGTVLSPSDFAGSLGPGNPLDAALRTTREYLARYGGTSAKLEPYPLLIVRPAGTIAYAVARAALKSWDEEFGYELVDADMKLAYPEPDPALKAELERTVADARERQVVLASIMPGRFKSAGTTGLVATSAGGFVPAASGPAGTGSASAAGRPGQGMQAGSGTGGGPAGSFATTFRDAMGGGSDGALTIEAAQQAAHSSGSGSRSGGGNRTASSAGSPQGRAGEGNGGSEQYPSGAATDSAANQLVSAKPGMPRRQSGSSTSGSAAKAAKNTPLAAQRGADWGLPSRNASSTGIQRAISVHCFADRLVLVPETGDYRSPTVIPLASATVDAVDPFVSAIWKRLEEWGIAGDNCYWKPVLRVQVAADAESRYQELATLLDGSGLVVERR